MKGVFVWIDFFFKISTVFLRNLLLHPFSLQPNVFYVVVEDAQHYCNTLYNHYSVCSLYVLSFFLSLSILSLLV